MNFFLVNITLGDAIEMGAGAPTVAVALRRASAELRWNLTHDITMDVDIWGRPDAVRAKYRNVFAMVDGKTWTRPSNPDVSSSSTDVDEEEGSATTTELLDPSESDNDDALLDF